MVEDKERDELAERDRRERAALAAAGVYEYGIDRLACFEFSFDLLILFEVPGYFIGVNCIGLIWLLIDSILLMWFALLCREEDTGEFGAETESPSTVQDVSKSW